MDAADNISVAAFDSVLRQAERDAVDSIMARRSAAGKGNALLRAYAKILL